MDYYSALNENEYWGNLVFKILRSSSIRVYNVSMATCRQMYMLVYFNPCSMLLLLSSYPLAWVHRFSPIYSLCPPTLPIPSLPSSWPFSSLLE